jgi:hypothetical protein
MLNTERTINQMPKLLRAFRKYIEKYECTYWVTPDGMYNLMFYHKMSDMPYLLVLQQDNSSYPIIYVNSKGDNWYGDTPTIREENLISNDMRKFIEAIRECKES